MKKESYMARTVKKSKDYYETTKIIIDKMNVYAKNMLKKLDSLKMTEKNFTCDQCGTCCDTAKTGIAADVFQVDLRDWINSDMGICLVSLNVTLHNDEEYALYIDRKEDFTAKDRFRSQKYKDEMVQINPSLSVIVEKEKRECVFFNSLTSKCSIWAFRPLGCKCFPFYVDADGKTGVYEKLCAPGCFKVEPVPNWDKVATEIGVMWGNIHGMKLFQKCHFGNTIGKDLNGVVKNKAEKIKKITRENLNRVGGMFTNMITVFYLLFPEYTNVPELLKEMKRRPGEEKK